MTKWNQMKHGVNFKNWDDDNSDFFTFIFEIILDNNLSGNLYIHQEDLFVSCSLSQDLELRMPYSLNYKL